MMCSSSMEGRKICDLPPGFRFHPTDEELIMYYLKNHATLRSYPVSSIVTEVDIYKFDPWELPEKAEVGENEWYFFTPRNRKYPNGMRPNRATTSGYWKATGTDKAIHSGSSFVGVRKTLVFYQGRPPRGVKTVWIMNEYRLADSSRLPTKLNGSMRMDDWVLCRIYRKGHSGSSDDDRTKASSNENTETICNQEAVTLPPLSSLGHVLETEYLSVSNLWNENTFSSASNIQSINSALYDNFDMDKFQMMFT